MDLKNITMDDLKAKFATIDKEEVRKLILDLTAKISTFPFDF